MIHISRHTELAVRATGELVPLSDALEILAARGIKVIARSLYTDWNGTVLLAVTEDAWRAKRVLEAAGFKCESNPVIVAEAREEVGVVASLGVQLHRAGVPIEYSHMAASGDDVYFAVFKTSDAERALRALQADSPAAAA